MLILNEFTINVACDYMNFMALSSQFETKVISHPSRPANGVGEEYICQHQYFHNGKRFGSKDSLFC